MHKSSKKINVNAISEGEENNASSIANNYEANTESMKEHNKEIEADY